MGYRRERPVYRLKFSDPALNGLVVEARSTSMAKLLDVSEAAANLDPDSLDEITALQLMRESFVPFVTALVSWNLEDADGNATPVTMDGLLSHDPQLIRYMVESWRDAQMAVPPPLLSPSGNGKRLPEVPMPMVPLSANPGN
jgi:hypothetical protein